MTALTPILVLFAACACAFSADLDSLPPDGMTFSPPGDGSRSYVRTKRGDCARSSFRAEVTVTLHGGGGAGCAFFGLGKGQANPSSYQEPATPPALFIRLAPSDFVGGVVTANVNGRESGRATAVIGDGTHRIRMTWDATAKRAIFEIDKDWSGSSFHADASVSVTATSLDFGSDAYLFAGGAGGVKFNHFTLLAVTQKEIDALPFPESFANDASAGTWLPQPPTSAAPGDSGELYELLRPIACRMRTMACWYDGAKLAATREFAHGSAKTSRSAWTTSVQTTPVAGDPSALDIRLTFRLTSGSATQAGVAAAFDFTNWSADNYVMIPASVYNGNRNRVVNRGYATGLGEQELYRKDLPLTTTDLPQLSPEPGKPSKLEVSTCNVTTPAICVFDRRAKQALIVLTTQGLTDKETPHGAILDHGLAIEENADRTRASVVVSAPGVRERKPEFIGFGGSTDHGITCKAGDEFVLSLRVYRFATPDIPGLLDKFMTVRKALTGPNHPRDLLPASERIRLLANRIDSRFLQGKEYQFYCPENAAWISFGWIGGLIDTFPMLALGDDKHLERVAKTFDFALSYGQGKSGYFYGALNQDGKPFGREGYNKTPEIVLTRKNGDVLFWMTKQLMLLRAQGRGNVVKPAWEKSTERLAEAFVTTWQKSGQWGNFLNNRTGEVAIYNTTGGAMTIGGLALAARYFNEPRFMKVARDAADFYYERDFVKLGMTTGACADILQNADSETAAAFTTSLMTLYETTGEARWLEMSRNLANLSATWTVSHDYQLPPDTELARLGAKLTGAVWASTQNKHGAPGICTSSGDALFKLYRASGDQRYAELIRDIVHAHAEGIKPDGEITERLTYCDADSRGSRGAGSTGWCELNGILMALELPGIYLRTDADQCYVFDSVKAEVRQRMPSGVSLAITNPTAFPAAVAICAETAAQAKQALGPAGFLKWPKVAVKPGETRLIRILPDGRIADATPDRAPSPPSLPATHP